MHCDQRENRFLISQYCNIESHVLDLCCYHGGFSMSCSLLGSAKHVTGIDSTYDAIEIAKQNAYIQNQIHPN
jgi:23S rRNA (cytosine1962-C5)-methyltransferase